MLKQQLPKQEQKPLRPTRWRPQLQELRFQQQVLFGVFAGCFRVALDASAGKVHQGWQKIGLCVVHVGRIERARQSHSQIALHQLTANLVKQVCTVLDLVVHFVLPQELDLFTLADMKAKSTRMRATAQTTRCRLQKAACSCRTAGPQTHRSTPRRPRSPKKETNNDRMVSCRAGREIGEDERHIDQHGCTADRNEVCCGSSLFINGRGHPH